MADTESPTQTKAPTESSNGEDDIIRINALHKWFGELHLRENTHLRVTTR